MVDLCFLGTLGGMPMVDRHMSATLINFNGRKILIDCGEGTQVAMRKIGWGFKSIDVICISHYHGDHTIGLPGLLATMGNSGREEEVTIIGPKGIKKIVDGLNVINSYLPYPLKIIEASGEVINILGNVELSTLELDHSAECIGYSFYFRRSPKFSVESAEKNKVPKLLWNKLQKGNEVDYEGIRYTASMVLGEERRGIRLSFITDTRPIEEIPKFIKNSDLFICEGTYGSDEDMDKAIKNKHMTFREAGKLAKEGNAKELILTHFSPALGDPGAFINNAIDMMENSSIAHDGLVKTLKYVD
ncbi:ribonuclease Z [Clostridium sp. LP20]|uniref:ribonuclease Z n=1 Tax=Clostridium sp. LP20 TaxID=3418665 RepID=UPI003EE7E3E9